MSSELRDTIESELAMMRRLLDSFADLLVSAREGDPCLRDMAALATVIHSFYNGAERVLKTINDLLDGETLRSESWHSRLLDSMARPATHRGPVLSDTLAARLRKYMEFRHMFRHAYAMEFQWRKMEHLVVGIEEIFRDFEREIRAFLETVDAGPESSSQ